MARRSLVERLLGDELIEMRLLSLPLEARYVWEHLIDLIGRKGEGGVIRLGCELGSELGFAAWFAHWFRRPETEIETQLETLHRAKLLVVSTDSISLPAASTASARRSEQARINGSKGGRPRSRPPEQPSMPLTFGVPLQAVENPAETQGETEAESPRARELASYSSSLPEKNQQLASSPETRSEPDAAALADELLELLGPAAAAMNRETNRAERVERWLHEYGVAPAKMREIVRQQVARRPVATLAYFEDRMRTAGAGPQLVATAPPALTAPAPLGAADPALQGLSVQDQTFGRDLLARLRRLEREGGLPEDPPQELLRQASLVRKNGPGAWWAIIRLFPITATWFGDELAAAG